MSTVFDITCSIMVSKVALEPFHHMAHSGVASHEVTATAEFASRTHRVHNSVDAETELSVY